MILKLPYEQQTFLEFLDNFLPTFRSDHRSINAQGCQLITSAKLLGESSDLKLPVIELTHAGPGNNRVALTRDGFKIMKDSAIYRALIAYRSLDTDDWRLSLMIMSPEVTELGKVNLKISNPKRYSFFLGPNARVNTPKKYLINLGKINNLGDLFLRFNVEIVTKEFFSNYRKLYENLSGYLEKDRAFLAVASNSEFGTDNFAKKLLGQIVFLYFVQRKGWLGAKAEDPITEGDQNFMRNLFSRCVNEDKNFFNDYLEPLFYDALNRRPERAGSFYRKLFRGQIPFLNGGLFEPLPNYDWQKVFLHIPNEIFSTNLKNPDQGEGILDIFDLYNFTVDESDAVNQEVSVDPEMLGKVFENLLPENLRKGKGTYYTPREIVHYMCHESLIKHLANDTMLSEKKVEDLANLYELPLASGEIKTAAYWEGEKAEILNSLSKIKVVDPACGSGAFLIGMLQEIAKLHHVLSPEVDDYQLRRKVIENNLYGVDIDPGAVEIAKLRLWLALVVDYEIPIIEPLPNLDYKIMQGNSLIEEFEEINFYESENKTETPQLINLSNERQEKIKELETKKQEYFSAVNSDKKTIKQEIDDLIQWLVRDSLSQRAEILRQQWGKHEFAKHQLSGKQWSVYFTKNMQNILTRGKIDNEIKNIGNPRHARSYFLWKLYFIEVFEENGGFDVVIANPPYDVYEGHRRGEIEEIRRYPIYEKATGGKLNAYKLFLAKSVELQKLGGILCVIFQNSFLADNSASKIRKFFLQNQKIHRIDSFPERDDIHLRVFENVKMSVCILISQNIFSDQYEFLLRIWRNKYMGSGRQIILSNFDILSIDQENASIPSVDRKEFELLKKISKFTKLKTFARCYEGEINITFHKKFLKKEKDGNTLMIKGAAVQRWLIKEKMSQGEIEYLDHTKYLNENSGNKSQHHNLRRIVMQGITGVDEKARLKMTIINPGIFCGNSVNYILISDREISDTYLLGLLNSKLLNWFFKVFSTNSNVNGYEVDNLPIKEMPINEQKPFIALVDKILFITQRSNYLENSAEQAEVRKYENLIDQLVYKLYGISPDEAQLIEQVTNEK